MTQSIFDIIIAGGGAAGCVVAGRLAAADPTLSILVVESGPGTRDDPVHTQPARFLYNFRPDSATVKFHVGKESPALGGRAPVIPSGQCLGGGSSVNFGVFSRPSASDYDDWESVFGNKGWRTNDLLPLLRKFEMYQIQPDKPTHGDSGPLKVSYGGITLEVGNQFLDVATQYDRTRGFTEDVNGLYECNKYGRWPKWIDARTGKRSDVPHHYIYPQSSNTNLHILTGHQVKRITFKDNVATGIEYVANRRFYPDAKPEVLTATARRMVVLSAGTFGSPLVLERSGIGAASILQKLGVQQIVDLPGVGENYQDHQLLYPPFYAADSMRTMEKIFQDDPDEIESKHRWTKQWKKNGTGMLATNGLDAGIKMRPSRKDLDDIGEAFRKRWRQYYAPAPDKPVLWIVTLAATVANVPNGQYFSLLWSLQHPESTGYVHATSAHDVDAPADVHFGFLDRPEDMALHKWGYKRTREFARRMFSYRGEVTEAHPAFDPSGKAAAGKKSGPVSILDPDLEYTEEDEKALEEYIRKQVTSAGHSLGTCAMKKREEGGVVDSRLNVYGVERLKIADLSICPANVAANTCSTAVLLGEKAAVMIGEELGISVEAGPTVSVEGHI
ncbi:alcohol oxidase-like protein [Trametes punicea]|nr:alcohol oxidase-like protein [Trametes punicea]